MSEGDPTPGGAQPPRVPISKRLVLINSASSIATRLLTIGAFAWVIQYLMNRIPEEELQLLPIVMAIAMLLPLLQSTLNAGLSRHVTEAYARDDLERITRIVSSQFPLLLIGAAVIALLGSVLAWNIDHILDIEPAYLAKMRFMLLLVVGRLAIGMCLVAFNSGLFAQQRFRLRNVIEIGGSLIRVTLMVWLILGIGPGVEWVIVAQVASQVFILVVSTLCSVRLLPAQRFRPSCFDWSICRECISFGGWYTVSGLANQIRRAADAPILNVLSTPVEVNNFFLGSYVESRIRDFAIVASQPIAPALTAMHAHGQKQRLAAAYLRGGRIALWVAMAMATPLMVFSYDLFQLYLGDQYPLHVDAGTVLILLLLGFPFTYPSIMLVHIALAQGDMRPVATRLFLAQLGNLALTIFLVGKLGWGAIGSATSTLVTFAIVHPFFQWPLALRMLDLPWRRLVRETLAPGLLPALFAAVAGFGAAWFVGDAALTRVIVGVPACTLTYVITAALVLQPADRADMQRVFITLRGPRA